MCLQCYHFVKGSGRMWTVVMRFDPKNPSRTKTTTHTVKFFLEKKKGLRHCNFKHAYLKIFSTLNATFIHNILQSWVLVYPACKLVALDLQIFYISDIKPGSERGFREIISCGGD